MDVKFFKCMHCGNVVVKVFDQGVPVVCCGENMVELHANDTDGAREKHVPQVTVDGATVTVKVGEVAHPMTEPHFITMIVLVTEKATRLRRLRLRRSRGHVRRAEGDKPVRAYEYCNLHGLWVAEI